MESQMVWLRDQLQGSRAIPDLAEIDFDQISG